MEQCEKAATKYSTEAHSHWENRAYTNRKQQQEYDKLCRAKTGTKEFTDLQKCLALSAITNSMATDLENRVAFDKADVFVCAAKYCLEFGGDKMAFEKSYFFQLQLLTSNMTRLWDNAESLAIYFQRTDREQKRIHMLKRRGFSTENAKKYVNWLMQIN